MTRLSDEEAAAALKAINDRVGSDGFADWMGDAVAAVNELRAKHGAAPLPKETEEAVARVFRRGFFGAGLPSELQTAVALEIAFHPRTDTSPYADVMLSDEDSRAILEAHHRAMEFCRTGRPAGTPVYAKALVAWRQLAAESELWRERAIACGVDLQDETPPPLSAEAEAAIERAFENAYSWRAGYPTAEGDEFVCAEGVFVVRNGQWVRDRSREPSGQ